MSVALERLPHSRRCAWAAVRALIEEAIGPERPCATIAPRCCDAASDVCGPCIASIGAPRGAPRRRCLKQRRHPADMRVALMRLRTYMPCRRVHGVLVWVPACGSIEGSHRRAHMLRGCGADNGGTGRAVVNVVNINIVIAIAIATVFIVIGGTVGAASVHRDPRLLPCRLSNAPHAPHDGPDGQLLLTWRRAG